MNVTLIDITYINNIKYKYTYLNVMNITNTNVLWYECHAYEYQLYVL